jgi:hypothetical protein
MSPCLFSGFLDGNDDVSQQSYFLQHDPLNRKRQNIGGIISLSISGVELFYFEIANQSKTEVGVFFSHQLEDCKRNSFDFAGWQFFAGATLQDLDRHWSNLNGLLEPLRILGGRPPVALTDLTDIEDLLIGSDQIIQIGADRSGINEDEFLFIKLLMARNLFDAFAQGDARNLLRQYSLTLLR